MGDRQAIPTIGKIETKREHYLPRFFLRHFVDDRGMISYVARAGKNRAVKRARVENVGVQNRLYETACPSGESGDYYFPNYIEKSLSLTEDKLNGELDWFLHAVLGMRPSDRLEDDDLDRLVSFVSIFIPHIVSRSPESVRYAKNRAEDVLETMRELDLGSSEKLKELYRETQTREEFDETLTFAPEAIAEQISLWVQILPGINKDEKFVRSSSLYKAVEYLRDCSMLILTTSSGHPFIGIDKPVRTVITDNLTTLYYPLSSQVAVILTDDGQHTFEKRSVSYRQLKDFNEVAFNDGNWNLVFCERSDYLNAYLRTEGTSNEQD